MKAHLVLLLVLIACDRRPRAMPAIYEIPYDFVGWVTVEYAVPDAPALPEQRGARVIRVPGSGRLRTSSRQELGVVSNRFYFVDGAGTRTPIDDPEAGPGAAPDEAARPHDHPVVLGFETGVATDAAGRRVFERFYVGPGPVGAPPSP
jgi:hypothetical protein